MAASEKAVTPKKTAQKQGKLFKAKVLAKVGVKTSWQGLRENLGKHDWGPSFPLKQDCGSLL